MSTFISIYLIVLNLIAFIIYGVDKYKAINNHWRISVWVLFSLALLGGSLGAFIGMKVYQHKTSVALFKYGVPTLFVIQLLVLLYVYIEFYNRVFPY